MKSARGNHFVKISVFNKKREKRTVTLECQLLYGLQKPLKTSISITSEASTRQKQTSPETITEWLNATEKTLR